VVIYPVILPVAEYEHHLPSRERAILLSRVARQALDLSAQKTGVTLGELCKGENDAPLPCNGHYWSVSHKPRYVAAVVTQDPVGIDIEEVTPRSESIFAYVASDEEWQLGGGKTWDVFFRYWTAKEAVLKAVGIGLGGLKKCRVVSTSPVSDRGDIVLSYEGVTFLVDQLCYDNHVASVLKNSATVQWIIPETPPAGKAASPWYSRTPASTQSPSLTHGQSYTPSEH